MRERESSILPSNNPQLTPTLHAMAANAAVSGGEVGEMAQRKGTEGEERELILYLGYQ